MPDKNYVELTPEQQFDIRVRGTPNPSTTPAAQPQPVPKPANTPTQQELGAWVQSHKHPQDRKDAADYVKMWLIAEHNAKLKAASEERQNAASRSQYAYEIGQRKGLADHDRTKDAEIRAVEAATALKNQRILKRDEHALDAKADDRKARATSKEKRLDRAAMGGRQQTGIDSREKMYFAGLGVNDQQFLDRQEQQKALAIYNGDIALAREHMTNWRQERGLTARYGAPVNQSEVPQMPGAPRLNAPPRREPFIGPSPEGQQQDAQAPVPFTPRENTHAQQGHDALLQQNQAAISAKMIDIAKTKKSPLLTREAKDQLLPQMQQELEDLNANAIELQKQSAANQYMHGDATKLQDSQREQAAWGQRVAPVKPEVQETDADIRKQLREIIKANTTTDTSGIVTAPTMQDAIKIWKEERDAVKALRDEDRKAGEAQRGQAEHERYWQDTEKQQQDAEKQVRDGLEYADYQRRVHEETHPKQRPASPSPEDWQPGTQDQTFDQFTPPQPAMPQFDVNTAQGLPVTADPSTLFQYEPPQSVQPVQQARPSSANLFDGMTAAPGGLTPLPPATQPPAQPQPIQTRVNGGAWQTSAPPQAPAPQQPTTVPQAPPSEAFQAYQAKAARNVQPEFYSPVTNTRYSRADVEAAAKKRGMTLEQAIQWLNARGMTLDFKE